MAVDGRISELRPDVGGTSAARDRARREALAMYWADRDRGLSHAEAAPHVMHEVRRLSEDDLWGWIKEYATLGGRELPGDFPPVKPSDEAVRPVIEAATPAVDDSMTALAPEGGRWQFDPNVTAAFDDMLQRSIPNYEDMRRFVTRAAVWHVDQLQADPARALGVIDLGASRGTGLEPIINRLGARGRYAAYETAPPMLEVLRARFEGMIRAGVVEVHDRDLREGVQLPRVPTAAILSVLTLQFIPIEYRQRLLRSIHEALMPGGCFILVEKVLGATAELDEVLVDLYYDTKRGAGYSQEAIDRKRLSLEGVLVPLTARMNEDLLRDAGFTAVDVGWAWSNFRGWLAVKR